MIDDREEIIARYAKKELTLEEAVERVDVDERTFKGFLRDCDIQIRPYPITKDADEIIAFLAREMTVPVIVGENDPDDYGLSTEGQDFIQGGSAVRQAIEKLEITTDEDCERVENLIRDHPSGATISLTNLRMTGLRTLDREATAVLNTLSASCIQQRLTKLPSCWQK